MTLTAKLFISRKFKKIDNKHIERSSKIDLQLSRESSNPGLVTVAGSSPPGKMIDDDDEIFLCLSSLLSCRNAVSSDPSLKSFIQLFRQVHYAVSSQFTCLYSGLSGLYSLLPRYLNEKIHRLTPDDVNHVHKLTLFIDSLEFCNAVAQVTDSTKCCRETIHFFLSFVWTSSLLLISISLFLKEFKALFAIAQTFKILNFPLSSILILALTLLTLHAWFRSLYTSYLNGRRSEVYCFIISV